MDRNSWIGIVLIVGTLFAWSYFTKPSEQEQAEQQRIQDSIAIVRQNEAINNVITADQSKAKPEISSTENRTESAVQADDANYYGAFAPFAKGEQKFYTVENNLIKVKFSSLGGRIYSVELKKYKTYDSLPLILFDGDSTQFGLNFYSQNRTIATNQLFFTTNLTSDAKEVQNEPVTASFRLQLNDNQYIEYKYTLSPDKYVVDFDVNFVGMNTLVTSNTGFISLDWNSYIRSVEKGVSWEQQSTTIFYKAFEGDVDKLSERSESSEENITTRIKWISYKQQFFNSTLIAKNYFSNAMLKEREEVLNPEYLKYFSSEISLPYESKVNETYPMQFYFGPNHFKTLKSLKIDLEQIIFLGRNILRWINVGVVIPMFNYLGRYILNYGIIILIMTIIIKMVLFPFTYKSYMSTAKMKALKPEIDKLGEKFPKKEDAMKKQQATMALYKKVGVSPMGGCLPMLFQMPILFALFRFFPASIELRQQHFLWADDLSSYDSILHLPFTIPAYGDHVSLFALLMTIVNVIYIKTNDQMGGANQQIPGMKTMMYLMPVMMLVWLNSYAAALSYYYFISLLITIIQTWVIRQRVDDAEILAKLKEAQANKKAPTKSKFQKRLEDMAKQRGYQGKK